MDPVVPYRPVAKKKKLPDPLTGSILQLKVRLLEIAPMIWRRVLIPASYTLEELHGVIQVAMGWQSLHFYRFRIRAVHYGSSDLGVFSAKVTLADFRFRKGSKFIYEYDMGDLWRHDIRVEDGIEAEPNRFYPDCIAGAHACPPKSVVGRSATPSGDGRRSAWRP